MTESHPHVASIVDTVMMRSQDRWDRGLICSLANEYVKELDGAPVQEFVEVLVIKEVMDEMRRMDALRPVAS